jgi:hypothetical protein
MRWQLQWPQHLQQRLHLHLHRQRTCCTPYCLTTTLTAWLNTDSHVSMLASLEKV